jgi:hypothetical protein
MADKLLVQASRKVQRGRRPLLDALEELVTTEHLDVYKQIVGLEPSTRSMRISRALDKLHLTVVATEIAQTPAAIFLNDFVKRVLDVLDSVVLVPERRTVSGREVTVRVPLLPGVRRELEIRAHDLFVTKELGSYLEIPALVRAAKELAVDLPADLRLSPAQYSTIRASEAGTALRTAVRSLEQG